MISWDYPLSVEECLHSLPMCYRLIILESEPVANKVPLASFIAKTGPSWKVNSLSIVPKTTSIMQIFPLYKPIAA